MITEESKYINYMVKVIDINEPERLNVFSINQLKVIFEGLLCGIDCIDFFRSYTNYSEYQMDELLDGLRRGLDIEVYSDPRYDFKKMKVIKLLLMKGYDKEQIFHYIIDHPYWLDIYMNFEKSLAG